MIELELTQRQIKRLKKHFDVVLECFMMKERGMLVGQVRRRWDGKTAFMHIGFVPSQHCEPLVCMGTPRVPNCWAGIPAVQHTGDSGV